MLSVTHVHIEQVGNVLQFAEQLFSPGSEGYLVISP